MIHTHVLNKAMNAAPLTKQYSPGPLGLINIDFQYSEYYSLRSVDNNNMAIPKHNTELFKKSFQYSGTQIWNALPITLRTACSLPAFKQNLHKHIVSNRV